MKKLHLLLCLAMVLALFTACGGDDDKIPPRAGGDGAGPSANNTNANPTAEDAALGRWECPRIKEEDNFVQLIRRTTDYGITYMIEWDKEKRSQRWTCFQMNNTNSVSNWKRKNWESTPWGGDPFQVDPDLPANCRTELSQYSGSGYSRGHICASADRLMSKEANEQTFYLSNIMPQRSSFNVGVWEDMEIFLRDTWNRRDFRDVLYIVKGGTIRDGQIKERKNGLVVPQFFYMAVVCERSGNYKGIAFWANHDNPSATIKSCIITIDELEEKTGIDFFCNLPDAIENEVEARTVLSDWGL